MGIKLWIFILLCLSMLKIKYPVVFTSKTSLLGSSGGIAICDVEIMVNYVQVQRHRGMPAFIRFQKEIREDCFEQKFRGEEQEFSRGVVVSQSPPLPR